MNVENSYIAITNAGAFQRADLEVLRQMVIMPEESTDTDHASFESDLDENFYAEGVLTKVSSHESRVDGTGN